MAFPADKDTVPDISDSRTGLASPVISLVQSCFSSFIVEVCVARI